MTTPARAAEAGAAGRISNALSRLQRTPIEGGRGVQGKERYSWFVAAALLLLAFDWWLAQRGTRATVQRAGQPESGT